MIAGPSGAGKTSIVAGILARQPSIIASVSVTTRPARAHEQDGRHYEFVSPETFDQMREAGAFIESAFVHGNRYGTPRAPVDRALNAAKTVVLEIDIQGAQQVRGAFPGALLIFVAPPSWEVLTRRLVGRGTDAPEVIAERLHNAEREMAAAPTFDHVVVNDILDVAIDECIRILNEHARHEENS